MDENRKIIYPAVVSLRNNETTLRWTRTQIFFLVHAAVLTFLTSQDDIKIGTTMYTLASFFGFVLALVWLRITFVIQGWVAYWDTILANLERDVEPLNQVFGSVLYDKTKKELTVTYLLVILAGSFAVIWLALTIVSFVLNINLGGQTWYIGNLG